MKEKEKWKRNWERQICGKGKIKKQESNKGKESEKGKLRKISRKREEKEGKKSGEKGEKVRKSNRVGGGEMVWEEKWKR